MAGGDIVAGSAGFTATGRNPYEWRIGPVVRYALELAERPRPRVCWVGTAGGDHDGGCAASTTP